MDLLEVGDRRCIPLIGTRVSCTSTCVTIVGWNLKTCLYFMLNVNIIEIIKGKHSP